MTSAPDLTRLFAPRAVAVIGVSEQPGKLGTAVLRNLLTTGYGGSILPVHPRLREIEGVTCIPRIADLPPAVDAAFLALPAAQAADAVQALADAGVAHVIVGSSGYAESGDAAGLAREAALREIARRTGIRIVGPNCNGLYDAHAGVSIGFNAAHARRLRPGGVAILSHSGALFDLMARRLEALGSGLSLFVSTGNEVQYTVLDYLAHAIADTRTRSIALLLDALPDAQRFRALSEQARAACKPIVVLKLGRSTLGSAAATAHSSRLVGDADAYAAFFAACGVPTVTSLEGLVTAAVMLERYGARQGGLIGVSTSGAGAALIADMADRHHIAMPAYAAATIDRLARHQRYRTLLNPTDLGSLNGLEGIDEILDALFAESGLAAFVGLVHAMPELSRRRFATALGATAHTHDMPLVLLAPGGLPEVARVDFHAAGALLLEETDCAFEAIAALLAPAPPDRPAPPACAAELLAPLRHGRMLTESASLALLARFGVPVARTLDASDADAAAASATLIGFPVAVKGALPGVAHKTEQGLVRLGLADGAGVREAFAALGGGPVVVQAMHRGELEAIVGVSRTVDVGPVLVAGLGGVFVEALRQTARWALPATRDEIARGLDDSALGRILASPRWQHAGSRAALLDTIMAVQVFALQAGALLEAVELNPLVIGAGGVVAVDALVIPSPVPAA